MKRINATLIMCLTAMAAAGQTADIVVSYTAHYPDFTDGKGDLTSQYILLAGASESKYFSPMTEYLDSLNSTPEGMAKVREMTNAALAAGRFDDIPSPDGTVYVVKNLIEGKLKHYDEAGMEKYVYEEPLGEWNWAVGDSTKNVLGYECVMATADYHGRKWTAWFAPEIPVQNGPWKLDGLPGLILEASAEGNQYSFVATGIEQTTKPIGPVYLAGEYGLTSRLDYLRAKRAYLDNPLGSINAQMDVKITASDADGKDLRQLFVPASVADFLETDYHK